jgi:drug/metabolite transporter (DMT)-like permease
MQEVSYRQVFLSRVPLIFVFFSGIGFSIQTLIVKVLTEQNFHASFQCIFFRGIIQLVFASCFIFWNTDRPYDAKKGLNLFGDTFMIKAMLLGRSLAGFGSIAFSFLATELISIGDSTILMMLSPMIAAGLSYLILKENLGPAEVFGTVVSLLGAVLVAKPPIIFGHTSDNPTSFYTGVTYALIAALSAASAFIFVRILGTTAKMPWANVCFCQAIAQIVLAGPSLYMFGQHVRFDLSVFQFGLIVLAGLVGAWSQIIMTIGMQREKSAAASAMRMSDVAFGYMWQVLFTRDKVNLLSVTGAVLITSSILVIVFFKPATPPPVAATDESDSSNKDDAANEDNEGELSVIEMQALARAVHSIAHVMQQDGEDDECSDPFGEGGNAGDLEGDHDVYKNKQESIRSPLPGLIAARFNYGNFAAGGAHQYRSLKDADEEGEGGV